MKDTHCRIWLLSYKVEEYSFSLSVQMSTHIGQGRSEVVGVGYKNSSRRKLHDFQVLRGIIVRNVVLPDWQIAG